MIPTLKHYSGIVSFIPSGSIWKYLRHIDSGFLSGIYFDILSGIRFRSCHHGITGETYRIISGTKNAPVTIERPTSAEIEVKLIGKCGSPAKLPKTEPASTILQWLDACDPLPTIAAKLQQRHLRMKQKEQPDWENSKGQQPQEGTGSAHSPLTAMGIHVGGIKPNSIFDGCDLDLEGCPL